MATDTHKDPEIAIENALSTWERWTEKHGKKLIWGLVGVVVLVGAFFGYTHFIQNPKIEEAAQAMFNAQKMFEQDDYEAALKGDDKVLGFEAIASDFSGTAQGNVAWHYAGMCNLYMGNFQAAIDAFGKFNAVKGTLGEIVTAQNLGMTGDAYVELGDLDNGLKFYQKAAQTNANEDTTPKYLHKAAGVCVKQGKFAEALEMYKNIKENYPSSMLSRDIDKYIAYVEQKM